MGKPDSNQQAHFFISQGQNLLLALLVTGLMQFSNHLAIYLIILCPFYFLFMIFEYYLFWKPKADLTCCFNALNIAMFIIGCPIFFAIFFAIFDVTASYGFKQVNNCSVTGSLTTSIESNEIYSILSVNFEFEGKQQLGYACASSNYQGKTSETIFPYLFFYEGDGMSCGPDKSSEIQSSGIPNRFLAVGGDSGGGGGGSSGGDSSGGGGSSDFGGDSESSGQDNCSRPYTYSKVKLASWLCLNKSFDVEEYTKPQTCYVNFFGDKQKAKENGLNKVNPRNQYDFPLISFSEHPYYPKADLFCLIIFCYYPFLLSFNLIFQYTSNHILKSIRKIAQKSKKNLSEQQYRNEEQFAIDQMKKQDCELNTVPFSNHTNNIIATQQNTQINTIPMNYSPQTIAYPQYYPQQQPQQFYPIHDQQQTTLTQIIPMVMNQPYANQQSTQFSLQQVSNNQINGIQQNEQAKQQPIL